MYKAFFQLTRNPFDLSPDPAFLYPTTRHYETLASLYYGIRARKGFVVVTGEVGTGKTMLVRCLLEKLDTHRVHSAYLFNPLLSPWEFLRYLSSDLGLPGTWRDKAELLPQLNGFLIRRHREAQTTVLVVDEAHLLSREVLEEIRLLTNLETSREKLLQIALVGQPELDGLLDSPNLRQLKQRIALRYQLLPLSWDEAQGYVNWRLKVAGSNGRISIFPRETLEVVFQYSRGYPRLINTICENALITAYAAGAHTVPVGLVEEVCRDLRLSADGSAASNGTEGKKGDGRTQVQTPEFAQALQQLVNVVESVTRAAVERIDLVPKEKA